MKFQKVEARKQAKNEDWNNWLWQMRNSLQSLEDFADFFQLSSDEVLGFEKGKEIFRFRTTPYYASLASYDQEEDPIRKILVPRKQESELGVQELKDPLGENRNRPCARIIHRYSDRVLFLVTDFCSVYCRYCTRKHFTATDQAAPNEKEYNEALNYIRTTPKVREVILSGGDPLTLSDQWIERILNDLRQIAHVEIIRVGTRMPVVCPMRITSHLVEIMKKYHPVYIMTHFNHPRELTLEASQGLKLLVDNGFPVFNQMVLLNGVNNHAAIVQALARRLLYLRVKPYYMFQCDPSMGTDHLRTSVSQSMQIQKEMWGHLSGLAMPNLSLDLPDGGGKVGLVPNFLLSRNGNTEKYRGWDGKECAYVSPSDQDMRVPLDTSRYIEEWEIITGIRNAKLKT